MGSCIICGGDTTGEVCPTHEEDVYFVFQGERPENLTPNRYYQGSVDGFADFGVFVNLGASVTGLLHRSELDRRLESLDWEPGDRVFVQVKNIRDNGNIDLGWSIRQHPSEFRGGLIDHPEGDRQIDTADTPTTPSAPTPGPADTADAPEEFTRSRQPTAPEEPDEPASRTAAQQPQTEAAEPEPAAQAARLARSAIADLEDQMGSTVRIEGEVADIRQTSGPTVFHIADETGEVECAAFESAGVRAYPEVELGDYVRLHGVVEERRGEVQVETAELDVLVNQERADVEDRIDAALAARAAPDDAAVLVDDPAVEPVQEAIVAAATAIRRAVFEGRKVVVRHSATLDGYAGAVAIERATLELLREEHPEEDAGYRYFTRRPLRDRIYGMQDAVRDVSDLLGYQAQYDDLPPLFVFVDAAGTDDSRGGLDLLDVYDVDRLVIDTRRLDKAEEAASVVVNPHTAETEIPEPVTTTVLCANVAVAVTDSVRDHLRHLPAVSFWHVVPARYVELAGAAGYDEDRIQTLREALALEAFYQAFEDKRELIADVLFTDHEIAQHASDQYRELVDDAVGTAEAHLTREDVEGTTIGVLDTHAFTHEYEFPPVEVLLPELALQVPECDAILAVGEDSLLVWSSAGVDLRRVGEEVREAVPAAGVETRGGYDGSIVFLQGEREAVIDAAITAVAASVS